MTEQRARALVIVESPTKAKTISRFLGPAYHVVASLGHVRDLPSSAAEIPEALKSKPWARVGVNIEEGFEPLYVVPADKKKHITELKALLREVDELYIATDEDREGESIGWHLLQVLEPRVPTKRMVFHEITEQAILRALSTPRALDESLVRAQETRRVLDRLVGYVVSPLLWKKIAPRLSAGRVQSAAVKILVERERARMRFVSAEWWGLRAALSAPAAPGSGVEGGAEGGAEGVSFDASVSRVSGVTLATSAHFDPDTGAARLEGAARLLLGADARALADEVMGAPREAVVTQLDRRAARKLPPPPFITSTLQQEANRQLGWSATQTMRVAQSLYESGYITYMRTDAPALASEAVAAIRAEVERRYGAKALPAAPRVYSAQSKGAQEAHEAIRPAGTEMRDAQSLGLNEQEAKLYTLIWRRAMACQMEAAELSYTAVTLRVDAPQPLELKASGRELLSAGFLAAYDTGEEDGAPLPPLQEGQRLALSALTPEEHHTRAAARFTEATLVKALESEGVGRPSTYASIIDTIQRRGYVRAVGRQLVPTFTAMAVTQLLERSFKEIVDPEFTAAMEGWLDEITTGASHIDRLQSFYDEQLIAGMRLSDSIDPREICAIKGPHYDGYEVRVGRFGPFIEYSKPAVDGGQPARATLSLPAEVSPDEVSRAWIDARLAQAAAGELPLGHSEDEVPVFARDGRYGPYVQLGEGDKPKRASLPKGLPLSEVTLEQALTLLSLPKALGEDAEGREVRLGLGRFGPYVQRAEVFASLAASDDLFTVGLERALELLEEKESSVSRRATPQVLRALGDHPEGGAVEVLEGRYGPYVKHGAVNASLPKGAEVGALTMEEALELLAARAAKAPKGRAGAKKPAAKPAAKSSEKPAAKSSEKPAAKSSEKPAAKPKQPRGARAQAGDPSAS